MASKQARTGQAWDRASTVARGVGLFTAVVSALLGVVVQVGKASLPDSGALWSSVRPILSALLIGSVAVITAAAVFAWRRRRSRSRVDARIVEVAHSDDANVRALSAKVRAGSKGLESDLVEHRAQRYLVEQSPLSRRVAAEVDEFLPHLPRSHKRLANHFRLQLAIAVGRGLLGGASELTHEHLAKWVVLRQQWPELGAALTFEPEKAFELERAETKTELDEALERLRLPVIGSDELFRFIQKGQKLGPVLKTFVTLEPARRL